MVEEALGVVSMKQSNLLAVAEAVGEAWLSSSSRRLEEEAFDK